MTTSTPTIVVAVEKAMARLHAARSTDQAYDDLGAPGWTVYQRQRALALLPPPPAAAARERLAPGRPHRR